MLKKKILFICVTLANDEICIIVYTLGYPMSTMAHVSFKEPDFLLSPRQRAGVGYASLYIKKAMYVCLCVCVSFMHYYTSHHIAVKLWEVVENNPGEVSAKKIFQIRRGGAPAGRALFFSIYVYKNKSRFWFGIVHPIGMKLWGVHYSTLGKGSVKNIF